MTTSGYTRFCPVAMACEMLEPRWTMLILCEMWSGSTRFSEIHRGVPGMSPSLLSRRLRQMQDRGLVERFEATANGQIAYRTTQLADELEPIVNALGHWAHRHLDPAIGTDRLDAKVLMWNIRRKIDLRALPRRRCVIEFVIDEPNDVTGRYWLIIRPNADVDLCMVDPRHDVDLFILAQLKALAAAWMGYSHFATEIAAERIRLVGDQTLARTLSRWLIRSSFAIAAEGPSSHAPVNARSAAGLR
ncbi:MULTISPECIES: helix-turn-helix domain-containing protein [unclassified Roseitalea]|uniref:winged helix-turn-helix transcriptional regulator n=1 Tax=unclassified Roseitalea TaxID=2639107 RepID=UPI00273D0F3A|nr:MULTISPECIES: helix-turn-helix domain-containing protein [unclassified Roseitalea]